ncbi:MAG: hypothetical protein WKG07_01335, partial [Hymenobacter sp.]
ALANKLGEAPVVLSQVKIGATRDLMTNRLDNRGFFHAAVASEVKAQEKPRKSTTQLLPAGNT